MEKKSKKTKNADNRNLYLLPFPSLLFRLKTFVNSWEFLLYLQHFFLSIKMTKNAMSYLNKYSIWKHAMDLLLRKYFKYCSK